MFKFISLHIVLFSLASPISSYSQNLSGIPGILVERQIDSTATATRLYKARYQQCISLKKVNMKLREEQPAFWKTASLSYSPDYIKNITVLPSKEPPWEKEIIGFSREKEYFHNEHYVLIHENFNYEISKDGLCQLIKTKEIKYTIDNGNEIYRITKKSNPRKINPNQPFDDPWMDHVLIENISIKKNTSPVIGSTTSSKRLSNTISIDLSLTDKLTILKEQNNGKSQANNKTNAPPIASSIDAIKAEFGLYAKDKNIRNSKNSTDHINIKPECDWIRSDTIAANICYWRVSHTYPSTLQRPIILRKTYNQTNESISNFEFIESIPNAIINIID